MKSVSSAPKRRFLKTKTRAVAVCALAAFGASGCALQTATYGTGEATEVALMRDVTGLVSFGTLGNKERERISYNERGELIIPPKEVMASMPAPIDTVDEVDESFPGRKEEIAAVKRREERSKRDAIPNQAIGSANAQPLAGSELGDANRFSEDEEDVKLLADTGFGDEEVNARIGANSVSKPRESLKTREDLAKELGVPIESIPQSIEERSLLERAGLVRPKGPGRQQRLTDVPVEYRTVQTSTSATNQANQENLDVILGEKKKDKKFLGLF
ncbi:MAG: hypothetical protein AAGE89_09175 [Pseudomonadota bacterium]